MRVGEISSINIMLNTYTSSSIADDDMMCKIRQILHGFPKDHLLMTIHPDNRSQYWMKQKL